MTTDEYRNRLETDIREAIDASLKSPGITNHRAFVLGWLMQAARIPFDEITELSNKLNGEAS